MLTFILSALIGQTGYANEPVHPKPIITNRIIHVYGKAANDGTNVKVGSIIQAYTPNGILCGRCDVTAQGYFGIMNIFGDDPGTVSIIEGANPGDILIFTVDGAPVHIVSDEPVRWSEDGDTVNVNLLVGAPDTYAPAVVSAVVKNPIHVEVLFDEAIDDISGQNTANYLLEDAEGNSVAIYKATVQSDPRMLLLNTDVLRDHVTYFLSVEKSVADLWGNELAAKSRLLVQQ